MPLRRLARNRQPQAVPWGLLPRCAEERLTQLGEVLRGCPRAMVAHTDHHPRLIAHGTDFDGLACRVEAQGVAQQVVHGPLDQCRPTLQDQPRLRLQAHVLVGRAEPLSKVGGARWVQMLGTVSTMLASLRAAAASEQAGESADEAAVQAASANRNVAGATGQAAPAAAIDPADRARTGAVAAEATARAPSPAEAATELSER